MADVELLYETPDTGRLAIGEDGRAQRIQSSETSQGPSLSGPVPRYGIGGSVPTATQPVQRPNTVSAPELSPEHLLKLANQMEDEFSRRIQEDDGPAARRLGYGDETNGFNAELTQGAERAYQRWPGQSGDSGQDYDLRGAFSEGTDRDPSGHLPDTWKKPNHPTFSNESIYAKYGNPGHWNGDQFVQPDGTRGPFPEQSGLPSGVPQWLTKYMSEQPPTDPYHVPDQRHLDIVNSNKYLTERERLKILKSLKKQ